MRRWQPQRAMFLIRSWQCLAVLLVVAGLLGWFLSLAPDRTGGMQLVVEPAQGVDPFVGFIGSAHTSLDGEIYLITSQDVLRALEGAAAGGVHVRLLLERYPFGGGKPSPENTFERLKQHGVDVRWAPRRFRFTHAKFLLRDGAVAWVGTMNWSVVAFTRNRGFALVSGDRAVARQLTGIFMADWRGEASTSDVSRLVVSPVNARRRLGDLIRSARKTLDVYAEVLGDPAINNLLIVAARRGVRVRVVWSGTGDAGSVPTSGARVVIGTQPYPHAKAMIADSTAAYLGSVNFSSTSLDLNREIGLITQDAGTVARLAGVFEADFKAGKPLLPGGRRSADTAEDRE